MGDGSPTVGQVRQSLCPLVTCGLIKLPDLSHRVAQHTPWSFSSHASLLVFARGRDARLPAARSKFDDTDFGVEPAAARLT